MVLRTALAAAALAVLVPAAGCGGPAHHPGRSKTLRLPWSLVSASGQNVVVRYGVSPCDDEPRVTRRESATTVVITVTVRLSIEPGAVCPASLRLVTSTVRLAGPLGGRRLLDGGTGDPPPTAPPLPGRIAPPPSRPVPVPPRPTADHTR